MITLKRTDSTDSDFIELVNLLDADLEIRDGDAHDFYHQFNAIVNIKHCVVLYIEKTAVGCGAIKNYSGNTMEVKRMFVLPNYRGKGVAVKILSELESWSGELGVSKCILETGIKQTEAIALYKKCGYQIIENYGQYKGIENSLCFEKVI